MSDVKKEVEIKATVTADTKGADEAADSLKKVQEASKIDSDGSSKQNLEKQTEAIKELTQETSKLAEEQGKASDSEAKGVQKSVSAQKKRQIALKELAKEYMNLRRVQEEMQANLSSLSGGGNMDMAMSQSNELKKLQREIDITGNKLLELTGRVSPLTRQMKNMKSSAQEAAQGNQELSTTTLNLTEEVNRLYIAEQNYITSLEKARREGNVEEMLFNIGQIKKVREEVKLLTTSTEQLIDTQRKGAASADLFAKANQKITQTATLTNTGILRVNKSGRGLGTTLRGVNSGAIAVAASMGGLQGGLRGVASTLPSILAFMGPWGMALSVVATAGITLVDSLKKQKKATDNEASSMIELTEEVKTAVEAYKEYQRMQILDAGRKNFLANINQTNRALQEEARLITEISDSRKQRIEQEKRLELANIDLQEAEALSDKSLSESEREKRLLAFSKARRALEKTSSEKILKEEEQEWNLRIENSEKQTEAARKTVKKYKDLLEKLESTSTSSKSLEEAINQLNELEKNGPGLAGFLGIVDKGEYEKAKADLKRQIKEMKEKTGEHNKLLQSAGLSSMTDVLQKVNDAEKEMFDFSQESHKLRVEFSSWMNSMNMEQKINEVNEKKEQVQDYARETEIANNEAIRKLEAQLAKVKDLLSKNGNTSMAINRFSEEFTKGLATRVEAINAKLQTDTAKKSLQSFQKLLESAIEGGISPKEWELIKQKASQLIKTSPDAEKASLSKALQSLFSYAEKQSKVIEPLIKNQQNLEKYKKDLESKVELIKKNGLSRTDEKTASIPLNKSVPVLQERLSIAENEEYARIGEQAVSKVEELIAELRNQNNNEALALALEHLTTILADGKINQTESTKIPQLLEQIAQNSSMEDMKQVADALQQVSLNMPKMRGGTDWAGRLISITESLNKKVESEIRARESSDRENERKLAQLDRQVRRNG